MKRNCMRMKNKTSLTLVFICLFFGHLGAHRFFLKKYRSGLLMMLTAGGLGVWYIIDIINVLSGKLRKEEKSDFVKKAVSA